MTFIILVSYFLILILIGLIISLILRIRKLERQLINFSPTEAYAIMENMHEVVAESERLASDLENSIKDREAILEDLSDIVDEKLARLDKIIKSSPEEQNIRMQIIQLYNMGISDMDIARRLNISLTEVRIALSLAGHTHE